MCRSQGRVLQRATEKDKGTQGGHGLGRAPGVQAALWRRRTLKPTLTAGRGDGAGMRAGAARAEG